MSRIKIRGWKKAPSKICGAWIYNFFFTYQNNDYQIIALEGAKASPTPPCRVAIAHKILFADGRKAIDYSLLIWIT
jgi:hypothetical protein